MAGPDAQIPGPPSRRWPRETGPPGRVPADWPGTGCIGEADLPGLYCDLGASTTLAHLRLALATELVRFKLDDLDAGDIRTRAPSEFTPSVSRYV